MLSETDFEGSGVDRRVIDLRRATPSSAVRKVFVLVGRLARASKLLPLAWHPEKGEHVIKPFAFVIVLYRHVWRRERNNWFAGWLSVA